MAKVNSLAGLLDQPERDAAPGAAPDSAGRAAPQGPLKRGPRPPELKGAPLARENKKTVTAHFPAEVSQGLRILAAQENTTVQALVGEAIDLLMRDRGRHPFGAR